MWLSRNILVLPRLIYKQLIREKSTQSELLHKRIKCGQPTSETHPHLLKTGEIIPCITATEFQNRRQYLIDLIFRYSNKKNMNESSHLVIIPSATKKYMSEKIPYVFRQNSDYLYLSGCMEPDSCLIINTKQSVSDHRTTLFVRNPDSHSEQWDGPRTTAETAPSLFGVDQSLPMCDLEPFLYSYLTSNRNCTIWYDFLDSIQPQVHKIVTNLIQNISNTKLDSHKALVHKLRLIKSSAEINLMRKSCEIASEAFIDTISFTKPDITEHQLFAKIDYECRMRGAEYLAYPPVVAGGDRATIIHYINNNQKVTNGELILMDAGCEYHGYSSDVTRTWPVNGKFSSVQKLLYEIIYSVQNDLIQLLHNFPTLDNLFDSMCNILGRKLQEAGLISRNASAETVYKTAFKFCPHHVSHYLGMDVHDTSLIPRNIRLQPGMIITVEPGIYLNDLHDVPREFQGVGVRIEDDVLITENGPVILTEKCPRSYRDIERIMNSL